MSTKPATADAHKPKKRSRVGRSSRIKIAGVKPNGRPSFEPTDAQRDHVRRLKLLGLNDDRIAEFIGCSDLTLRKHFEYELQRSRADLLAVLAAKGYQRALNGDGNMIQFFLRTQAGWVERKEVTGLDGKPLIPATAKPPMLLVDFSGMLDD